MYSVYRIIHPEVGDYTVVILRKGGPSSWSWSGYNEETGFYMIKLRVQNTDLYCSQIVSEKDFQKELYSFYKMLYKDYSYVT